MPRLAATPQHQPGVGIVVIGRNQGWNLPACFASVRRAAQHLPIVYVDSTSGDDSVNLARAAGVEVVEMPADASPSAARARNLGVDRLRQVAADVQFVQFIDGDCTLCDGWLEGALPELMADAALAAVWGWRRERHPDASVYNRVCNLEWRIPAAGECRHFGGDALVRLAALDAVAGYDPAFVASEDHEISARLRAAGWRIRRLDASMTITDSRMTRFGQWWRRCVRRGLGYAQMWARHHDRYEGIAIARILAWAIVLPILVLALLPITHCWSALALLLYPLRAIRISFVHRTRGGSWRDAVVWGAHCVAAAVPYAVGLLTFASRRLLGREPRLIEYQPAAAAAPPSRSATRRSDAPVEAAP